jgi:hypothetical protein
VKVPRASGWIALPPEKMGASWQVRRIRSGQQQDERVEAHLIEGLH